MNEDGPPLSAARAWNIAFRTAHIAATGALFGGHVFDVPRNRLLPCLYLTILTGIALLIVEFHPEWRRLCEVRAAMIAAKLCLLCFIPWFWSYRVAILILVIVIASVGSHMPRRYRYYSLLSWR